MNFRAAIVFLALAVPAFAQHGGAHAGSFGGRGLGGGGFAGHAGFSSHSAFSEPRSFARPAQPARYGFRYAPYSGAGFRAYGPQGLRSPYYGNRFAAGRSSAERPAYNPRAAGLYRGADRDSGRFDRRRRQFDNWYVNTYPNWLGYPYLIDPGFYDWGDDSASDTSQPGSSEPGSYESDQAYDQNGPAPLYPPYPEQSYDAPNQQPAEPSAPLVSEQALTVIFKNGRAPIKVRNYLMTAKVLTDLDSEHYEQIPLDQIDLAATQRFNTSAGVDFQVPGA